jgi:uncharacterized protein YeaO (DUF488 family)
MQIFLERIYDTPQHDGYRVLADRVWPRGVSKEKAGLDEWCRDLAPSTPLRKWFGHDPAKWREFQDRYRAELDLRRADAAALLKKAGAKPLVLLSGARDVAHTHTIVLKEFLLEVKDSPHQ